MSIPKKMQFACIALWTAALAASAVAAEPQNGVMISSGQVHITPTAQKATMLRQTLTPQVITGNGITYNGGPIMANNIHVYLIWYGNWAGNSAVSILTNFVDNIGQSPYFNTTTPYCDTTGACVANDVQYWGSANDNYSHGTALNQGAVGQVVAGAIGNGSLPLDANGVYMVLSSADVTDTDGFCTQFCGWHSHGSYSSTDVKYAWIGNASVQCPGPTGCPNQSLSPNGNPGADSMASVLAHELVETATDPDINAWSNPGPNGEIGDLCAWNWLSAYTAPNGSVANVHLGSNDYLIQSIWQNANGGGCALSYQPLASPVLSGGGNLYHQNFTLSWNAVAGVNHYTLSQMEVLSVSGEMQYFPTGATSMSFSKGFGTEFFYSVRACSSTDESTCGVWSNSVDVNILACPARGCP